MPKPETVTQARAAFDQALGASSGSGSDPGTEPDTIVVRAPGRVNILGEHTDHNDGLCLPAAIDLDLVVVAAAGDGIDVVSDGADPLPLTQAVAAELNALGRPDTGIVAGVATEIPVGGGLSSSAAFEAGVGLALAQVAGWTTDDASLAAAYRRAEHAGLGVPCGPLDQMAVIFGRAGEAMFLDCRDLSTHPVTLPEGAAIIVVDSGISRELATSGYATRVAECKEAARELGVASLRDAQDMPLSDIRERLPARLYRRARHVITENERVREATGPAGRDALALGQLLNQAHISLSSDYEASLPEIDEIAERLQRTKGIFGARLTGAGWGGSLIALAVADRAEWIAEQLPEHAIVVHTADGAGLVD